MTCPYLKPTVVQALTDAPRKERGFKILLSAPEVLLSSSRSIQRSASEADDDAFEEKHQHVLILGNGALFECSTMTVELAVMEPGLCYPYHKRPPV